MVGKVLQPSLNAIVSIFSLYAGVILGYPRRHAAFPVRLTRLFAHVLCNSPYRLKQAQNMSSSVLLTTEASQLSVEIAGETALYQYRRFSNDCKEGSTNR